jgi:hypothetical protein
MKLSRVVLATARTAAVVAVLRQQLMAESDAHKSFDLFKGMEGKWAGKNSRASRWK